MGNSDIVDVWAGGLELPVWFADAMAAPREEGYADVGGARFHYFRWGKRGKPPLLLTHGFLAHARCWAFIAPLLAEDYDIVAYDLAGMGESEIKPGCDMAKRAADMVGLAEMLDLFAGPAKPVIIAHSFGSAVALAAMEQAGDRFGGLVMCDMMVMRPEKLKAHIEGGGGPPGSGKASKPNNIYPDYESARRRFVLAPPQDVQQPFLLEYMAYHSMRRADDGENKGWCWKFDPKVFARSEKDQNNMHHTAQRAADLPHNLAIIYGANSKLFDDDSAAYIRELGGTHIPMFAVPDAEHHLMLDQPLALVDALQSILVGWR